MAADPFEPASAALFEAARQAGPDHAPTTAERTRAFEELRAAVAASDPTVRRRHAARALILDPGDDHARVLAAPARIAPPTPRDAEQRARFRAAATTALDGARGFVAVAAAAELTEDPALLRAWAAAFAPGDDATLAIVTHEEDLQAVHARLAQALDDAGLGADTDHDLALVLAAQGAPAETGLAREAHAVLGAAPSDRALAGHPRAGTDDPHALRVLAERRWSHDGFGAPLTVSIQICPQRWDGAERWGDTHFARALADELERRGHDARIEVLAEWDAADRRPADVTIHLRGLWPYVPRRDSQATS